MDNQLSVELSTAPSVIAEHKPVVEKGVGGGLEGAEKTSRETVRWTPFMGSPDQLVNRAKPMADARGRDIAQNDGYANGAVTLHQDNIVGQQFRLNAQPNYRALGVDEAWAEQFQDYVESRFNVIADSADCWLDVTRRCTLTEMVRLAVAVYCTTGEVVASAEWLRENRRPFSTAVKFISPDRLCNPDERSDEELLRRGVVINRQGRPLGYWFRNGYRNDPYGNPHSWRYIPAEKPWGRKQILHIVEQRLPDQNRGISDMVAVLKQMRMTKQFQEIVLQNAVVNATYAAAIESELPTNQIFEQMGGGTGTDFSALNGYLDNYLSGLAAFLEGSKNIAIDGVKIPHLFPGTKLNMQPVGSPGGVGDGFEQSLLRHIAASLGLSYEQFSRDYTKTNYSSARASMNETYKFMLSRKKLVADRTATFIYLLWLEEEVNSGRCPLPAGKGPEWFYEPLVKDALGCCSWIGASRGQIDEKKETEAAVLRIEKGLSTYEIEAARLGLDWRDLFSQRAREQRLMTKLALDFTTQSAKKEQPASDARAENESQEETEE